MKLIKTTLNREESIEHYKGYTEINSERFALKEPLGLSAPELSGNHILFSYEYDRYGAETGYTKTAVLIMLNQSIAGKFIYTLTYGGYVNQEGVTTEENGYLLTFDDSIDPVTLGALSHKIADLFRQESVSAIYKGEVTFIYA